MMTSIVRLSSNRSWRDPIKMQEEFGLLYKTRYKRGEHVSNRLENTATKERKLLVNVNSLCSRCHYVNSSC